jgi:GNAT superfamily N-acetyltransferase
MRTHQTERVSELWDEMYPLLEAHWEEIAHYKDIPLEPDVTAYAALEEAGALRCYTVRDADKLIGYAVFFVRRGMHYSGSLQAIQDVLFLLPEYRRGGTGPRLIRYSERQLAAEGVQAVYHHCKITNRVGGLLVRLGYELIDEVYGKRLDKGDE